MRDLFAFVGGRTERLRLHLVQPQQGDRLAHLDRLVGVSRLEDGEVAGTDYQWPLSDWFTPGPLVIRLPPRARPLPERVV